MGKKINKVKKWKSLEPILLCTPRISFIFDREVKRFTDKKKLRVLGTTKTPLSQTLNELFQMGNTKEEKRPTETNQNNYENVIET